MIAVVDYGVGNLFSLISSLQYVGARAEIVQNEEGLRKADSIILPGVGAFGDAAAKLRSTGLIPALIEECGPSSAKRKPLLGICLGMQLLFDRSLEYGEHRGLGFIRGDVIALDLPKEYKVPHMGWNALNLVKNGQGKKSEIFKYINDGDYVYYVHSYHAANCRESVTAYSDYSVKVTGAVQNGNIYGTQFHPEKSGETGLKILRAFAEL